MTMEIDSLYIDLQMCHALDDCPICKANISSRKMFIARLENEHTNGRDNISIAGVLALMNDCDMLAALEQQHKE